MNPLRDVSPARWLAYLAVCVALAAVGGYLWIEHRQHFGGVLFYGPALACLLMHFMHRGHGHGGHGHSAHEHGRTDQVRRE